MKKLFILGGLILSVLIISGVSCNGCDGRSSGQSSDYKIKDKNGHTKRKVDIHSIPIKSVDNDD